MSFLPKTMRAVHIKNPGPDSRLEIAETPLPACDKNMVLIKVHAAGINRPDLFQRQGNYPPPPGVTDIPGLEVSGEIADCDPNSGFTVGDHVLALIAGGGYAEYVAAPVEQVLPLPQADYDMIHAAAIPETFFTVWTNLFDSGALKSKERLLIHGGSSGIGTTAIQIAKSIGCHVTITAGTDKKCAACRDLGADRVINYKTEAFEDVIRNDGKVDVILDMVGGDYIQRNLQCLAPYGRHVSIASLNGNIGEIEIFRIMKNRLILTGSTLRARSAAEKGKIAAALHRHIWPDLAGGKIVPVIDSVYDFNDVAGAHQRMQDGEHIGKIVLKMAA